MSGPTKPTVSIGLPVYNGARYVALAIEAVLGQSYRDLELIICDNASTDETAGICQSYAAKDARIRYHRQPRNLGAAANFNRTFELSSGQYFKWAAHDDLQESTFLERCLEALEANPDAVLSQSLVGIIDDRGARVGVYDPRVCGTDRPRASDRFGGRLRTTMCTEVFGLIRADALRGGRLIADHIGSDWTLLADLALQGRFIVVPEILFLNRNHFNRGSRPGMNLRDRHTWYAAQARQKSSHSWVMLTTCTDLVRHRVNDPVERLRCYGQLLRWLLVRGRLLRLMLEPLLAADPRVYEFAVSLRAAAIRARDRHFKARV